MNSFLRDIDREKGKMQGDIDNLLRHYEKLAGFVQQYTQATTTEWARLAVNHPSALLLIVETTGIVDETGYYAYGGEVEPIRFTAYHLTSETIVLDQLIHPTHSYDVRGFEYHGLRLSDIEDKPLLSAAWPTIQDTLENHHIIIFGADYARKALLSVPFSAYALDSAFCLHDKCKEYYNEFYNLSLEQILSYQGIDRKRDELRNSQDRIVILAQVLRNLAAGMTKQDQESEDSNELDEHPF